jgi:tetratricopeptide (TPR) repeat protein
MQISLRSNPARISLSILEMVIFLVLTTWIVKAYLADLASHTPTVQSLQRAAKLDPSNSDYLWRLGRLYQYNLSDIDPDKAVEHLTRATEVNPYNPEPWLDLGTALDLQGKTIEAEAALRRADFLAPNLPAYQWAIGNFFLLHGNVKEALRHFKVVLAGTNQYNQILFETAWKASETPDQILTELIPEEIKTETDYLYYLIGYKRYAEGRDVWRRIMQKPEGFSPQQAAPYIDSLIVSHRPSEAYQVWTDLRNQNLLKPTYLQTSQNLIINGDFEEDLMNMGFDWRIAPAEGVYAGVDTTTFHSPSHSVMVQFPGTSNIYYGKVYQYVVVKGGRSYRLRGFMKTQGITTDSGPRLEVLDPNDPAALDQITDGLTGDTMGWTQLMLDFRTGPKTELIIVRLARRPSKKLDNQIAGKVWIDDLSLTELSKEAASPRR